MDPSTATVNCPDCAQPIPLDGFADWGAQTMFKSAVCPGCETTVTYPSTSDGLVDVTRAPIGRGVHGTTRASRETEVLASRPTTGQRT